MGKFLAPCLAILLILSTFFSPEALGGAKPFKKPSSRYAVVVNPIGIIIGGATGTMLDGFEIQVGLHKFFALTFTPQFAMFDKKKFNNPEKMYGGGGVIGTRVTFNWLRTLYPVSYTHLTLPTKRIV